MKWSETVFWSVVVVSLVYLATHIQFEVLFK